jgi:integrase
VTTHAATATARCRSLQGKKLSPHVLRHTNAMSLLHAGVDTTVIAFGSATPTSAPPTPTCTTDLSIKE